MSSRDYLRNLHTGRDLLCTAEGQHGQHDRLRAVGECRQAAGAHRCEVSAERLAFLHLQKKEDGGDMCQSALREYDTWQRTAAYSPLVTSICRLPLTATALSKVLMSVVVISLLPLIESRSDSRPSSSSSPVKAFS